MANHLKDYLKKIISFTSCYLLKTFNLFVIIRPELGLGDQVCMTIAIDAIKNANPTWNIVVLTKFPEVFYNNKKIFKTVDLKKWPKRFRDLFWSYFSVVEGNRIELFGLKEEKDYLKYAEKMKNQFKNEHTAIVLTRHFKCSLLFPKLLKPELFLTSDEVNYFKKKFGLPENFAIIHSQGFLKHLPIKEWGVEKIYPG